MKIGLVSAAVVAALALCTSAFGQAPAPAPTPAAAAPTAVNTSDYSEQRVGGDQVVTFTGDPLKGDDKSTLGFTLRRPPGVLRAGLIRPRVNFVSELLKTVENL